MDILFALVFGSLGLSIAIRRKEVARLIYLLSDGRGKGIKASFPPPKFKITENVEKWRLCEHALLVFGILCVLAAGFRLYVDLFAKT